MNITKKDFVSNAKAQYNELVKMEKMATKLEKKIADIRAAGYKIIVLGPKVKITR